MTVRLVHLIWGARTLCGLTLAQAADEYAHDAPICPQCGPRSRPNYPEVTPGTNTR